MRASALVRQSPHPWVIDHFERADGNPNRDELGRAYVSSATPSHFTVESNRIRRTGGVNATWQSGCDLSVDIGQKNAGITANVGPNNSVMYNAFIFRDNGGGAHYLVMIHGSGTYIYWSVAGYSYSFLAQNIAAAAQFAAGDLMQASLRGQQLTVWRNGNQVLTYSVPAHANLDNNTRFGVQAYYVTAGYSMWDNLIIGPPLV